MNTGSVGSGEGSGGYQHGSEFIWLDFLRLAIMVIVTQGLNQGILPQRLVMFELNQHVSGPILANAIRQPRLLLSVPSGALPSQQEDIGARRRAHNPELTAHFHTQGCQYRFQKHCQKNMRRLVEFVGFCHGVPVMVAIVVEGSYFLWLCIKHYQLLGALATRASGDPAAYFSFFLGGIRLMAAACVIVIKDR